jgi:hypothetical protein
MGLREVDDSQVEMDRKLVFLPFLANQRALRPGNSRIG